MSTANLAKFNMIEQQMRPWEVIDPQVLAAIDRLDRADFVAEGYRGLAYADCQIPVADGVRMLPPTIEGRLLQALLIGAGDRVLEVGCGCGYLTACLAELGGSVTAIDARQGIVDLAREQVRARGYDSVVFECLALEQLDRDRQFDVIGQSPVREALLITRLDDDNWQTESLFETDLPRL